MAETNDSTPQEQDAPAEPEVNGDATPANGNGPDPEEAASANGKPVAVVSDIHANLEAWQAVLADIEQRKVERIICLGDTLGYGPNPCECLDLLIEKCEWSLMGNHDFAVLYEPTSFNASAESASFWTRQELESEPDADVRERRWVFLGGLEIRKTIGKSLYVHASPRRPINEYIFPDDVITAPEKIAQIFDRIDRVCYCGHTHVAGVFSDEPDFYPPGDIGDAYEFAPGEKCIINPGSLGQPRDRDARAAYAIVDDKHVEFVRVEYDIDAVMAKVNEVDQLTDFLGQRLMEGR